MRNSMCGCISHREMGDGKETTQAKDYSEEKIMTHEDVKMERICSVCGAMYSEIITEECPVCRLEREIKIHISILY